MASKFDKRDLGQKLQMLDNVEGRVKSHNLDWAEQVFKAHTSACRKIDQKKLALSRLKNARHREEKLLEERVEAGKRGVSVDASLSERASAKLAFLFQADATGLGGNDAFDERLSSSLSQAAWMHSCVGTRMVSEYDKRLSGRAYDVLAESNEKVISANLYFGQHKRDLSFSADSMALPTVFTASEKDVPGLSAQKYSEFLRPVVSLMQAAYLPLTESSLSELAEEERGALKEAIDKLNLLFMGVSSVYQNTVRGTILERFSPMANLLLMSHFRIIPVVWGSRSVAFAMRSLNLEFERAPASDELKRNIKENKHLLRQFVGHPGERDIYSAEERQQRNRAIAELIYNPASANNRNRFFNFYDGVNPVFSLSPGFDANYDALMRYFGEQLMVIASFQPFSKVSAKSCLPENSELTGQDRLLLSSLTKSLI